MAGEEVPAGTESAAQPGTTPDAHTGTPITPPAAQEQAAAERPTYLPEKFWDPKSKAPNVEALATSYGDLERKLHMRSDDLAKSIRTEVEQGIYKDRPAKAEDYQLVPPKGFLPDGMEFEANRNDPLFKTFSEIAHKRGLSQEDVSLITQGYLESVASQIPDPVEELKALGGPEKGQRRVERTKLWAQANMPKEHFEFISRAAGSARAIQFVEWVMEQVGEPRQGDLQVSGTARKGAVTAEELTAMQADPRYWDPLKRDPSFVERVTKGWQALAR